MVYISSISSLDESLRGGSGGGLGSEASIFVLSGSPSFQPFFVPRRNPVSKERNINRKENYCGGEDVTDYGSKNREIHLVGFLLEDEIQTFNDVLDSGRPFDLVLPAWSGEVLVIAGEIDGPVALEGQFRQWMYEYSLDLVSTGRDESTSTAADGIISSGNGGSEGFIGRGPNPGTL
jgi:hypothetical protein